MHGLRGRGRRDAIAVGEPANPAGLMGLLDGALVKALAQSWEPCVLVTWDNKMPLAHRAELDHHGTTLAVVDERWFKNKGLPPSEQAQYICDVVQRWLHRIEIMPAGARRYYSAAGSRKAP